MIKGIQSARVLENMFWHYKIKSLKDIYVLWSSKLVFYKVTLDKQDMGKYSYPEMFFSVYDEKLKTF